jgi:hypothetical protein
MSSSRVSTLRLGANVYRPGARDLPADGVQGGEGVGLRVGPVRAGFFRSDQRLSLNAFEAAGSPAGRRSFQCSRRTSSSAWLAR